jgi:heterodisulfide reductase subunit C
LAVIIVSGVFLESTRILSPTIFNEMVDDYMGNDDPEEVAALRQYWATTFGAWHPPSRPAQSVYDAAEGQAAHEAYCASCHSPPQAAFLSYPTSRLLKPVAGLVAALRFDIWLWYFHYLASCLALACLPFSSIFHLIATPANLLARATGSVADSPAAQRPARRALGLDACTHCGACSVHCSVAPIYRVIPNTTILPSEKLQTIRTLPSSRMRSPQMAVLAEGSFICTLCGRCTRICPSGIELQDLWQAVREDLLRTGWGPAGHPGARPSAAIVDPKQTRLTDEPPLSLGLTDRPETFWACVQCTTCTSVCPVVAASDNPQRDLDLTPQQIMNLMRLQLKDEAFESRMLWDCVTCYKCQEHCPQDVKVADVLYELRNEAYRRGKVPVLKTGAL